MAVYAVRSETSAIRATVAIQSVGTWARAPGHVIAFSALGVDVVESNLEIDDRVVRLVQREGACGTLTLHVQLATPDDRVVLRAERSGAGTLRIASGGDYRISVGTSDVVLDVVLFLDRQGARAADAAPGDN